MQSERSDVARMQYELDMVNTKLSMMADTMYKGCEQIHKAHMTTIQEKYLRSKANQDKCGARKAYKARLA